VLDAAVEEAGAACAACGADRRIEGILRAVAGGTWTAPVDGVSLDPYDTLAAALHCVRHAAALRDGLLAAVQLRGDTDTVAALVGGLLGVRSTVEQVRAELPWSGDVLLPDADLVSRLAAGLAALRAGDGGDPGAATATGTGAGDPVAGG
jgi:hypothetical protein